MTSVRRTLGLWPASALVIGHTIAVGIFLTPAELVGALSSPGLVITLWVVFGLLVLFGAFSFGELASRHPQAGGPYVFLREAWGPRVAFLYGWQCLLVMDPGVTAALAAGLAEYLPVMLPGAATHARWWAVAAIWVLAGLNLSGIDVSTRVMAAMTALKLAALAGITLLAFTTGSGSLTHFSPFWERGPGAPPIGEALALASVAAFFSFGGFWEASRVAGEVRDPQRTLPRALALGVGIVAAAYLTTTLAFIYLVRPGHATSAAGFAASVGGALFGSTGARVLGSIVVVSILASMLGLLLMAPRVYYAMSQDGLFPRAIAQAPSAPGRAGSRDAAPRGARHVLHAGRDVSADRVVLHLHGDRIRRARGRRPLRAAPARGGTRRVSRAGLSSHAGALHRAGHCRCRAGAPGAAAPGARGDGGRPVRRARVSNQPGRGRGWRRTMTSRCGN